MNKKSPLITVTMPAYNNETQIAEAIESVLNQTFTDLELVIVNDGSMDHTEEVIKSFKDERIVYFSQPNKGASQATNRAIEEARGKYIALFAADDVCYPHRLERAYRAVQETGARIIFGWADIIGDDNKPMTGQHHAVGFFNHPERTQAQILNYFFFKSNYLCTVSSLIERQLLIDNGLFWVTSAQLPDYGMWLKLIKNHPFHMITEKLIKYRVHADNSNVSNPVNTTRTIFELTQLQRNIFDDVPVDLFKEAFVDYLKRPDFSEGFEYELEKAFLFLNHELTFIRMLGAEKLFNLLQEPAVLEVSTRLYNFGLPDLLLLTKKLDFTNQEERVNLILRVLELEQAYHQVTDRLRESETLFAKLDRFEKDLRDLQNTRTVRFTKALKLIGSQLENLTIPIRK